MSEAKQTLSDDKRLRMLFVSQGHAPRTAATVPDKFKKKLLALCDKDGRASAEARVRFPSILREMLIEHKASVEGLDKDGDRSR